MKNSIVSYNKKPRKSKTSEVVEIDEINFYLYNAKSTTKGITEIYLASLEPYPLINVSESNEKAKLWLKDNISRVKAKMLTIGSMDFISREEYIKKDIEPKDESKRDIHYPTIEELQEQHNKIKAECEVDI